MVHSSFPLNKVDPAALQLLEAAVERASQLLLQLWPGRQNATSLDHATAELRVETKSDGSLVSQADLRSNEILTRAIKELFPQDMLISEEGSGAHGGTEAACWIIDPLDGTTPFLQGRDDFSILVGCWQSGNPILGLMKFPARNLSVVASSGEGCTINGNVARVSNSNVARKGHVYTRNFSPRDSSFSCTPRDSGLALLQVASGELDGAIIKMTSHKVWDVAAPIVAIREAGGMVTDENGKEVTCGAEGFPFQYVVASNFKAHRQIITLI